MEKITFCIPSKSNLRYLKTCIPSIRTNAYRKDHDIIVFVDADADGTVDWLQENSSLYNITYYVNPYLGEKLFGIGEAYDFCIQKAKTDIVMVFHADMMLGVDADLHAFKHLKNETVVCSTRIEPPIHPNSGEKILKDFGMWPEEFNSNEFNLYVTNLINENKDKITEGMFAPWMIYKHDLLTIGGHDPIMKSAREDSDLFNRFSLKGYKLVQSWDSLVYHLTGRGGQFQHGTVTSDDSLKSQEWSQLMMASTKEFIRKWGSYVKHNLLLKPVVLHKYDIEFDVSNANFNLLEVLEPWCSNLKIDLSDIDIQRYIDSEQKFTSFDLKKRINDGKIHDIVVSFDGRLLNNETYRLIEMLSEILDSNELSIGTFKLGMFHIKINKLHYYEQDLIHRKVK